MKPALDSQWPLGAVTGSAEPIGDAAAAAGSESTDTLTNSSIYERISPDRAAAQAVSTSAAVTNPAQEERAGSIPVTVLPRQSESASVTSHEFSARLQWLADRVAEGHLSLWEGDTAHRRSCMERDHAGCQIFGLVEGVRQLRVHDLDVQRTAETALAAQLAQVVQERDEQTALFLRANHQTFEAMRMLKESEAALAAVRAQLEERDEELAKSIHQTVTAMLMEKESADALAAVRAACQQLANQWRDEADSTDAKQAPRYGDGYPETDWAIESKAKRACAAQLDALGEPKAESTEFFLSDPMEQKLRDLIAKWRDIGNRPNRPTGFILCADELEAALAVAPPAEPPAWLPYVQHQLGCGDHRRCTCGLDKLLQTVPAGEP